MEWEMAKQCFINIKCDILIRGQSKCKNNVKFNLPALVRHRICICLVKLSPFKRFKTSYTLFAGFANIGSTGTPGVRLDTL